MERMDVKRKLTLLKLYESYWLMLPSEIQEYVMIFKISQDVIEMRKKEQKAMICEEIVKRHKLKEAWGLGPIICRVVKCKHCSEDGLEKIPPQFCNHILHFRLCGVYTDLSNAKKVVFLGYNIPNALKRIKHVKSIL